MGLYACRVKRLKSEKRKPAYFLGFIGFLGMLQLLQLLIVVCLVVVAWAVALVVSLVWVVVCGLCVGGFLSLRTI